MTATELDDLACKLKPLFRQREALCCSRELSWQARQNAVAAVEAKLRETGLAIFVSKVSQICYDFLRRNDFWRLGSTPLDSEDFVMEALIRLTAGKLQEFEPDRARFVTWFKSGVLRTTFAEMKRRQNPYWGRTQLMGERAQQSRSQARAVASPASLDGLVGGEGGTTLKELLGSNSRLPEFAVLEEQCAQRFRDALRALSPEEQVLVERAYIFDEKHEAIARSLGVTRAAVTRRLGRICARLLEQLGDSFCEDCRGTDFAREMFGGGTDGSGTL